ncbi:hypothetical protein TanjilG_09249 [Lupinus angustifolius]|uniref:FLZ-type domain-containing protein n=1 Tax=Lupinus angustifolius TaxID=3871 RepID=A0A4P1QX02_LUPAN|nr:PREDICTED: uncharacterized protein LOC109327575 [Lupinus angustifolius]OIV96707.1 hypothetical protein TanjilG_09249 [Lupinus angustifolius]
MSLGKRGRGPMKRTTSMSDINFDLNMPVKDVVDPNNNPSLNRVGPEGGVGPGSGGLDLDQRRVLATVSAMKHRRNCSDLAPIPDFLRTCSFCRRRLVHGRDIYMYRGDSGFCSLECRQKQMNQDERKDNCFVASKKQVTKAETLVAL